MLDPVPLPDRQRVHPEFGGQFVHDPLDGERRLRAASAAVGVGRHLGGEHAGAFERVGVHLVDGRVHERAEQRHPRRHQHQVGAHVGQQVDRQATQPAVAFGRHPDPLPLVAAVVHGHVALAAGLGPLDRPAELAGDQHREHFLGGDLELGAEATAHVGGDDPDVLLRDAEEGRQREPQHVRDLGGRPQGDLTGHVTARDHRARFHRARDQPLLPVVPLDHHRRIPESGDGVPLLEDPLVALVARLVHLRRALGQGGAHVEDRGQRLVFDIHRRGGIGSLVAVPGDHHGDRLTDVADFLSRHRRVVRDDDVRCNRPRAGQAALRAGEVGAGEGGDHTRH